MCQGFFFSGLLFYLFVYLFIYFCQINSLIGEDIKDTISLNNFCSANLYEIFEHNQQLSSEQRPIQIYCISVSMSICTRKT